MLKYAMKVGWRCPLLTFKYANKLTKGCRNEKGKNIISSNILDYGICFY